MHKSFPDWYKLVDPDPKPETIERRWGVIEAKTAKLTIKQLLNLVSIFSGANKLEITFMEELNAWFQEGDASFSVKNNIIELRVLGSSLLANIILKGKENKALIAALGVRSIAFGREIIVRDVLEIAQEYLTLEGSQKREIALQTGTDLSLLDEPEDVNNLETWLPDTVKNYNKTIDTINRIEYQNNILSEECNILWWLINQEIEQRSPNEICLSKVAELATLTKILPEPPSTRSLLFKALSVLKGEPTHAIELCKLVNSTSRTWRESFINNDDSKDIDIIVPMTLAIRKSIDTNEESGWFSFFEKASQLSPNLEANRIDFMIQFYSECIFRRALKSYSGK